MHKSLKSDDVGMKEMGKEGLEFATLGVAFVVFLFKSSLLPPTVEVVLKPWGIYEGKFKSDLTLQKFSIVGGYLLMFYEFYKNKLIDNLFGTQNRLE